jgi:uncharacterized membrane protein
VIWVIGISMIVLAAAIKLPLRLIAAGSVTMIALHNLLDIVRVNPANLLDVVKGNPAQSTGLRTSIWIVLHQPGIIRLAPNVYGLALYPLIPWIGVMAAGYAFGALYQLEAERRRRILFRLGAALLAGFILIRGINIYGDPNRWSSQKNAIFTLLSFLNVSKYPPSLLFLRLTLGAAILALPSFERIEKNGLLLLYPLCRWFAGVKRRRRDWWLSYL